LFAAQRHERVVRKTQRLAQGTEMLFHESGIEAVMTGGYRPPAACIASYTARRSGTRTANR
jgi:hypothetical protein